MKSNLNYLIKCTGVNLNKFIEICRKECVEFVNIKRLKFNEIIFELNESSFKIFRKISFDNYQIEILKFGGVNKLKKFVLWRLGLVVGLALSIAFLFITNNMIFNIKILGVDENVSGSVLNTLKDIGVDKYLRKPTNMTQIEDKLSETYNFSLVSAIFKGNALIINIKEEIDNNQENVCNIVAEHNMIINDIEVYSGYTSLKSGDVVYAGDVLVYARTSFDVESREIKPSAKINCSIFFVDKFNFYFDEKRYVRTGKKIILNEKFMIGDKTIIDNQKDNTFEYCEVEEINKKISNYFIPLSVVQEVAYETKEETFSHDFESEKEDIVNSLKCSVHSMNTKGYNIEEENVIITDVSGGKLITYFNKCNLQLRYN